jgi:catechol 2,3-dioxygenase-like lactoylglutathione lyase family enzyme
MRVLRLDHLVLTVASIPKTVEFYKALGFESLTFGDGRTALAFGQQKINLHQTGRTFEPKAKTPTPGSADLCFIVERLTDVTAAFQKAGLKSEEGPVRRTGATGPITSLYIRDPDGNLLEFSEYEV